MRFWGLRGLGKKGEGLADEEGSAPSELVLNTGSNGDSQDKTSDV